MYNDHKCFKMLEQLMRFKCKNEFGGIRIWWIRLSFYAPNETHQPTYRFGDSCNYCVLIRGIWFSQALIKSGKLDSRGSFHHIHSDAIQTAHTILVCILYENIIFKCRSISVIRMLLFAETLEFISGLQFVIWFYKTIEFAQRKIYSEVWNWSFFWKTNLSKNTDKNSSWWIFNLRITINSLFVITSK